jgi:hypothetical protein
MFSALSKAYGQRSAFRERGHNKRCRGCLMEPSIIPSFLQLRVAGSLLKAETAGAGPSDNVLEPAYLQIQ